MKRAAALPAACIAYALLTLLLTYPLVWHLSSVLPHDAGDPVLNAWLLWWNAHELPLTSRWWSPPTFYPLPGVLALSEHLLGLAPLTSPLQWLGASPPAAYNAAFLLSFLLSATAAYWLVLSLTGRHDAAFIAGLAFGFTPYRMSQLAHLQVICSYLMPVALVALHRYVDEGRTRWLVLFGGSWLLQSLTCGYYLFYFSVLVGLWVLWFAARPPTFGRALAILAAWAASAACLVPVLLGYERFQRQLGLHRAGYETDFFSADVASMIQGSALLRFWKLPSSLGTSESLLFPGVAAVTLVALALIVALGADRGSKPIVPRVRAVMWVATGAFAIVALSALLVGPWRVALPLFTVSVGQPYKPLSLAVVCGLALLVTGGRFRAAWRRRSTLGFYACAAGLMWLLSFGPSPRLLGHQLLYRAPYAWLMWLPGFDALRVPPRFAMLATLCLSVAAGSAFVILTARWTRVGRVAGLIVCAAALCADGWITALPLIPAPSPIGLLRQIPQSAAVLELPMGEGTADAAALYRSIWHQRALLNGYSGFTPPHYFVVRFGLLQGDQAMVTALAERGPIAFAVHEDSDPGGRLSRLVSSQPGALLLGAEAGTTVYLLPRVPPPPATRPGPEWPIRRMQVNVGEVTLAEGRPLPGPWCSPKPQQGNEEVFLDLGVARRVEAVVLTLDNQIETLARAVAIDTSEEGRDWTEAWRGSIAAPAYRGAVEDPANVRAVLPFGGGEARWIRLRQIGSDEKYPWCFARIAVTGR